MADTTADMIEGMIDMRIRQAVLVTALRRLGEPLRVTHGDCYDAARFDVKVLHGGTEMIVSLVDAPN